MDTNIGRRVALGAVSLALMVTACSGGSLSLPEYAEQAEELVARVRDRIAALDTAWLSQAPTVDGVEEYWNDRLDARVEFLEDFRALKPPNEAAELHENVGLVFERLNRAEEALATRVVAYETVTEHWQGWDTVEGKAAQSVDQELTSLCYVAQEELDRTEAREIMADMPWFPSSMKDVVRVALGCDL